MVNLLRVLDNCILGRFWDNRKHSATVKPSVILHCRKYNDITTWILMNILTHMTYYELLIFSGYVLQAEPLVLNNETNINPTERHCCLWTFWILNNTHNAPLLSGGLPQVTFDLPGTCWIQIKCRFVLLRLNKLNPSTAIIRWTGKVLGANPVRVFMSGDLGGKQSHAFPQKTIKMN